MSNLYKVLYTNPPSTGFLPNIGKTRRLPYIPGMDDIWLGLFEVSSVEYTVRCVFTGNCWYLWGIVLTLFEPFRRYDIWKSSGTWHIGMASWHRVNIRPQNLPYLTLYKPTNFRSYQFWAMHARSTYPEIELYNFWQSLIFHHFHLNWKDIKTCHVLPMGIWTGIQWDE